VVSNSDKTVNTLRSTVYVHNRGIGTAHLHCRNVTNTVQPLQYELHTQIR
jgi:hypothetical protein